MHYHPLLPTLLFILAILWPVARIYKRVGLNPAWALLLFVGLAVPVLGLLLTLIPLGHKAWPLVPKITKQKSRSKSGPIHA